MFVSIPFHKEELCTSSRQNPFIKGCPPPGRHGQTLAWTAANAAAACIWNIASQITWKISPQNCKSEQGHSFAPQNALLCIIVVAPVIHEPRVLQQMHEGMKFPSGMKQF